MEARWKVLQSCDMIKGSFGIILSPVRVAFILLSEILTASSKM